MTIQHSVSNQKSTNVRVKRSTGAKLLNAGMKILWTGTPYLAKYITDRMFFIPHAYKTSQYEYNLLNEAVPFKITISNKKEPCKTLHCWKWGSGPGILFIHGWAGRGIQFYNFFPSFIEAGFSVITYDGPGHGVSEGKKSNYFELSEAVKVLIQSDNDLNIKGIVAHSLGASATIHYLSNTDRSVKTVLISPALKLQKTLINAFNTYGVPVPVFSSIIKDLEILHERKFEKEDPKDLLKSVNSNILIIHDTNDRTIPYEDSKNISDKYYNLDLHTTHGLGHKRILNDPLVIKTALNYISSCGM